jgi:MFS family permease
MKNLESDQSGVFYRTPSSPEILIPAVEAAAGGRVRGLLAHPMLLAMLLAGLVSYLGDSLKVTAISWLVTTLTDSPLAVTALRMAASLAILLISVPAGVLADSPQRYRVCLLVLSGVVILTALLGLLTFQGLATPWLLILIAFALAAGGAVLEPAWTSVVLEAVSYRRLSSTVLLQEMIIGLAYVTGPFLAILIFHWVGNRAEGAAVCFWLNAAAFIGVFLVFWNQRNRPRTGGTTSEPLLAGMRAAGHYLANSRPMQTILVRCMAFVICATALMSLLPYLVRHELGLGITAFGWLRSCQGIGGVLGTFLMLWIRHRFRLKFLFSGGTIVFALVTALFAAVRSLPLLCAAFVFAGVAWVVVLTTLQIALQTILPPWIRGRGTAVFTLMFQAATVLGSLLWGVAAEEFGALAVLWTAAGGLLASCLLLLRYGLVSGEGLNLMPQRKVADAKENGAVPDSGPVLVTIEYLIESEERTSFVNAMRALRQSRLRNGATYWELLQDSTSACRYLETFRLASWSEYTHFRNRMSALDQAIEELVHSFDLRSEPPPVLHYKTRHWK